MPITSTAPAKINLGLVVKGTRPDGYHDIETIIAPISLADRLTLETADGGGQRAIELAVSGRPVPGQYKNLVWIAAQRFFNITRLPPRVDITLEKTIPVGAGLGGGSSDAAATLSGLNRLFGLPLKPAELEDIAVGIGMDVPFFLKGGPCFATGRGEILEPVEVPGFTVFLHFPGYPISTRWAYQHLAPSSERIELTNRPDSVILLRRKLESGDTTGLGPYIVNSFEELVFEHHPDLKAVKELFLRQDVIAASLSGSGSTVFALTAEGTEQTVARSLQDAGIKFMTAKILNRFGASSSGRTQDFGSCWGGSNPPAPVN